MLIDGHIHFEKYIDDLDSALNELVENNILAISVTCDIPGYERTLEIATQSNLVLPAFGVHAEQAPTHIEKLEEIREIAERAPILGEIGLDHDYITDSSLYPAQEKLFRVFLESAEKKDTPMILHVAGAEEEVLSILDSYSVSRVIIHDYYGPLNLIKTIIDRSYFFSFDKSYRIEYKDRIPNWGERQKIATLIPDNLLLTETDGPGRVDWRTPYQALRDVIDNLATLRNTTSKDIESIAQSNFLRLFQNDTSLEKYAKFLEM